MSCDHCPRRGLACRGSYAPRFCDLVDPMHPDHRPEYAAVLDPASVGEARPLVPLADSLRAIRLRDVCPHSGPALCGCSGSHHCGRAGGDVNLLACLDCPRVTGEEEDRARS